jgi:membrane fusion protein (multidrug efflux system)
MTKLSRSQRISIFVLIILLISVYVWLRAHQPKIGKPQKADPTVAVFKIVAQNYQPFIDAVGTLQANQGAILKAQTSGQVEKISFTAGEMVHQGDVLVELNNSQQKGALDAAVAQEKLNITMYQRDLELQKLGAISSAAVDQAKAAVDAGKAAVQEAQANYDLTITTAPFSGRVGISKINLGDYLQAADAIVSLQNLDPMFVDFYLPQKYLADIHLGATVLVTPDTTAQATTGKITSYETVIDQNTGMLQVRAALPNPQQLLLPGGYVTLQVDIGTANTTLNVPQTAVMYDAQGSYVYIVKDKLAHKQRVTVGAQIGQEMQILQGLEAGDVVVSAGTNKVHDNSALQAVLESAKDTA